MPQSHAVPTTPLTYRDVLVMAEAAGLRRYDFPLSASSRDTYLESHSKRYAHLLNTVGGLLAGGVGGAAPRLLDIGPGFQTQLLHDRFPGLAIDTLGFTDDESTGFLRAFTQRHHPFDLNDYHFADRDPGLGQYDIVVFCEVIEHLYTMPETVLQRLRPHLAADGALVVQTPNAVQWRHRVRMLLGRNPYDRITPYRMGHYREYTVAELHQIAAAAGFRVGSLDLRNYFGLRKRAVTTAIDHLLSPLPSLRAGMTAVLRPI